MPLPPSAAPSLDELIGLFYPDPGRLATFEAVEAEAIPVVYRDLLAHEHHMTVTVEHFYQCPVDVRVHRVATPQSAADHHYAREITLTRQSDGSVVQFGIVRIDFDFLSPEVRAGIERQDTPLGRILIRHNVLRKIHLSKLYRVSPGFFLRERLGLSQPIDTYGRTALIECDHKPAIELLEIVTPIETVPRVSLPPMA